MNRTGECFYATNVNFSSDFHFPSSRRVQKNMKFGKFMQLKMFQHAFYIVNEQMDIFHLIELPQNHPDR